MLQDQANVRDIDVGNRYFATTLIFPNSGFHVFFRIKISSARGVSEKM